MSFLGQYTDHDFEHLSLGEKFVYMWTRENIKVAKFIAKVLNYRKEVLYKG